MQRAKRLVIDFYPPLSSGAPAPYDPTHVNERSLSGIKRDIELKRIFTGVMKELGHTNQIVTAQPGRVSVLAPSKAIENLAKGIPFVSDMRYEY